MCMSSKGKELEQFVKDFPTYWSPPPSLFPVGDNTSLLQMIHNGIYLEDRRYKGSPRAQQRAAEQTVLVAGIVKELTILLVRRTRV